MTGHGAGAPATVAQVQNALASIHAGRMAEAEVLLRRVLAAEPRNFNALQLLGHVGLQTASYQAAVHWLTAARAVNPGSGEVLSNLAVGLLALGRPAEALDCCDQAIAAKTLPEAHCNRGHALAALGRTAEAALSYRAALALAPASADAYLGLATALETLGRHEEALAISAHALQNGMRSGRLWCQRGSLLLRLKRAEEALPCFDAALALEPRSAEALNNRGAALRDLKRFDEALAAFRAALGIRPDFVEAYCNVANVGLDLGKTGEALGYCDEALRLRPDFLEALNLRGTALRALKRYEEAVVTYRKILGMAPDFGHADSHLCFARANLCDWTERSEQAQRIIRRVAAGESASSPHTFLWLSECAAEQLACARRFLADEFPAVPPLWCGDDYRHPRLRVAYLSADFTDHPVAHLLAGVIERHDRSQFESFALSVCAEAAQSTMRVRLRQAFEHFVEVGELTDRQIAGKVREWEIDVLVDLTGHTRGGRLGVLAHRAAPVQINFLGFAGTSGADFVDYLIGDSVAIPPERERFLSEKLIRMPHSFLPNDDRQPVAAAPSRRELALPEAAFVFCAFNNPYKINPRMFDVWMRLLRQLPGSVLWLRGNMAVRRNLAGEAQRRGVAAERLVFANRIEPMDAHLARYRCADLFLDTLPYGAHATARDALWAGLPVLTCAGDAFASRVAASLLTALDLQDLITSNLDTYAERARALAESPRQLAELRAKLAERRASAAFDTDRYRRDLESAYVDAHARRITGVAAQTGTRA